MPDADLTLTTETTDGVSVIHVAGELDLSTVTTFDAEFDQSLFARGVVIDLAECTFLDSSALRAFVRAQNRLSKAGGRLILAAPSQPASRVLEIATLERFTPIFGTLADAISSLA